MELMLTREVENALSTQALLQGTTPEQLALDTLRERFVVKALEQTLPRSQGNLLDFLDGFIGVLHSAPTVANAGMSQDTGKAFTRILAEKRTRGRV